MVKHSTISTTCGHLYELCIPFSSVFNRYEKTFLCFACYWTMEQSQPWYIVHVVLYYFLTMLWNMVTAFILQCPSLYAYVVLYPFLSFVLMQINFITRNTFCGTWYLPHSRVHKSIAELCSNFGDSAITKGQIAYFPLRMRKTALFLLPVKNLTSPSCSPTPISYNTREFWRYVNI